MHSDRSGYWADRQVTEFCGELIDTGHQTIRDLARRFHPRRSTTCSRAQPRGTTDTYSFFGDYYPSSRPTRTSSPCPTSRRPDRGRRLSDDMGQAPRRRVAISTTCPSTTGSSGACPGGHRRPLGALLDVAYADEYGADTTRPGGAEPRLPARLPAAQRRASSIFGESDERFHIRGGNEQLPEAIAAALPNEAIKTRLVACSRSGQNANGSVATDVRDARRHAATVTADQRDPRAPVRRAAQPRLRRRGLRRAQAAAPSPSWAPGATRSSSCSSPAATGTRRGPWGRSNGNVYSDVGVPEHVGRHARAGRRVGHPRRVLRRECRCGLPSLDAVLDRVDESAGDHLRAAPFCTSLEMVFPGITRSGPGRRHSRRPSSTRCSTARTRTGASGSTRRSAATRAWRRATIHFAGEHTSQDFQGFMEGGASEGVRAGEEVLAAI